MKKKKKRTPTKITVEDFIKAVKKADREIQLENNIGWVSKTKIHKSKKIYSRKNTPKNSLDE